MSMAATEPRKHHYLFVGPDRTAVAEVEVIDLDEPTWQSLPISREPGWTWRRYEGRVQAVRLTI